MGDGTTANANAKITLGKTETVAEGTLPTIYSENSYSGGNDLVLATGSSSGGLVVATGNPLVYDRLIVTSAGNVGIGTTTPTAGLMVLAQTDAANLEALYINTEESTTTQAVFSIETDTATGSGADTVKFKITADGSTYNDANTYGTPADLAEMYYVEGSPEEGDIVQITNLSIPFEANVPFGVERAVKDSGKQLVGVISTKPGLVMGYDWKNPEKLAKQKPVALAGRAPVKVNMENGAIAVGDRITSSSVAGVGMKATKDGNTIGVALESYDGTQPSNKILVFINLGYQKLDINTEIVGLC